MKNKFGVQTRVFLSFSIAIIIIVNFFIFGIYKISNNKIQKNIKNSILSEYSTIQSFIDLQKTQYFSLPDYEIQKISSLGFFFSVGKNDINLQNNFSKGFITKNSKLIFRGDYKNFTIIIGKDIKDLENYKNSFTEILLIINLFLIILSFLFSYLITNFSLRPLYKLSLFLNKYDFSNKNKILENNFPNTEIGILTKSINKFINQNNNILENQKDFIQDVNHELKTPIMQIDSTIEILEESIKEEKILEKINIIKNSTKNINEIISNLGFILRGEKAEKKKKNINLYLYLKKIIKNYEDIANKKNIKIILINNSNLTVQSNTYFLDRLFGNIISNAIFYNNGNNEIRININNIGVSIKDKGIGISKNEQEKIFSRFYRNKNSGIYSENGNGLGLTIVQKICNLFGWKIEIKSEKGKGTIFKIIMK